MLFDGHLDCVESRHEGRDLAALAIDRFKVDFAVIGASAIDISGDLLDFDPEEVRVSQAVIKAALQATVK